MKEEDQANILVGLGFEITLLKMEKIEKFEKEMKRKENFFYQPNFAW